MSKTVVALSPWNYDFNNSKEKPLEMILSPQLSQTLCTSRFLSLSSCRRPFTAGDGYSKPSALAHVRTVQGGISVEIWDVVIFFSWQLHSQKCGPYEYALQKKLSRFTADLPVGGEGFYTGTVNRIEIQAVWASCHFSLYPMILYHFKCHILHNFCWSNKNNQPITSDFHPFQSEGSTHGAALAWTRAGSVASVSASREGAFRGLKKRCDCWVPKWLVVWRM